VTNEYETGREAGYEQGKAAGREEAQRASPTLYAGDALMAQADARQARLVAEGRAKAEAVDLPDDDIVRLSPMPRSYITCILGALSLVSQNWSLYQAEVDEVHQWLAEQRDLIERNEAGGRDPEGLHISQRGRR